MVFRGKCARALAFAGGVLLASGCSRRATHPADDGAAVAKVFETADPYSRRTIAATDLATFFEEHPEYAADSADVTAFYRRRDMQFAWILGDSLSETAEAFIALVGVAAAGDSIVSCHGCATTIDVRLTAEFFRFARRDFGRDRRRAPRELTWFIPRAKMDYARLVDSIAAGSMNLEGYLPSHSQYPLLRRGIERYSALANEPWPTIRFTGTQRRLTEGDSTALVGMVRRRLYLLGDLEPESTSAQFDSAMVTAVSRFQARHGLRVDGVVGSQVLRALNVTPAARVRTMLVNIERLRWVPELPPNVLYVNIPEFRLHVFEEGREVMSMEVVVGASASATRTVVFRDTVTQVVFSPSWTVPPRITRDEIVPAMQKDPDYLRKHDMEVVGGTATDPVIRQRPSPDNPLGGVKFVFPNAFDIYMHDSPARALFDREERTGSHGCIRVSRATDLVEYLLRHDPEWPPERIREAMTSGRETPVRLVERIPVAIGYFTAWVDDGGRLNFRDDIYGHDARLARELFAEPNPAIAR